MIGDYAGRSDVVQGEEFDASPEGIESRLERAELSSGTVAAYSFPYTVARVRLPPVQMVVLDTFPFRPAEK